MNKHIIQQSNKSFLKMCFTNLFKILKWLELLILYILFDLVKYCYLFFVI